MMMMWMMMMWDAVKLFTDMHLHYSETAVRQCFQRSQSEPAGVAGDFSAQTFSSVSHCTEDLELKTNRELRISLLSYIFLLLLYMSSCFFYLRITPSYFFLAHTLVSRVPSRVKETFCHIHIGETRFTESGYQPFCILMQLSTHWLQFAKLKSASEHLNAERCWQVLKHLM